MKLSVVTITCRSNPRLLEAAKTLVSSFRRAPPDTELQWLIVDDRLWWQESDARLSEVNELLARQPPDIARRFTIDHFAPPPSRFRGPTINDPLPAHNTARNAGLAAVDVDVDYVIYLSDCTVVTRDWVKTACEIAATQQGWKCTAYPRHDLVIPEEPFAYRDCWDNLHRVAATSVSGPCWGAPLEAFTKIAGFDIAYDGEDDFYDHEALVRLGRAGVQFVTTKRACVVRLARTQLKDEVTTRQEVLRAAKNRERYNALVAAGAGQILPGHEPHAIGAQPGRGVADRAARAVAPVAPALVAPVAPARAPAGRQPPATPARAVSQVPRVAGGGDDVRTPMGDTFMTTPDDKPTPPLSLHEKAKLLQQQRVDRAKAEKEGTAPPLTEDEQCPYVPNQGASEGQRCTKRARHGGAHGYAVVPVAAAPPADAPPQTKPAVPREPPSPPAGAAATRESLDTYARGVQQRLADIPASYAKNVALIGRVLLREGELVAGDGYLSMLADCLRSQALREIEDEATQRVRATTDPEQARPYAEILRELQAAEQRSFDAVGGEQYKNAAREMLPAVQHLCLSMPPIPCTPQAFDELRAFAAELDRWRQAAGLAPRGAMSVLDRGYAAAADAGIDIDSPDDFGDALADDLTRMERRAAAGDDEIVSTEPLSDEEAAAQDAAAAAMLAAEEAANAN